MIMYWSVMDEKDGMTPRSETCQTTSRSDGLPQTSRSGRGRPEPDRASIDYNDMVQDLGQAVPVMVDSHLMRFDSVTKSDDEGVGDTSREQHLGSVEEDDGDNDNVSECVRTPKKKWPSYHKPANGLRIITWDEFLETPDMLNGQFRLEKNGYISHDPSQLNVFFQDSRLLQATLGSLSHSGRSWTVFTEDYSELKSVRNWLTERISVLVVKLHNRNFKRHSTLGQTACCLIAIDPSFSNIKEKIHFALSQAMDSYLRHRQFCVIIDLNSSVERWCQETLRMRCNAYGGRIVITNGDEPPDYYITDKNMCCQYLCLPFKLLQGTAYKLQRRTAYDDYDVIFDEDHIVLCTANTKLQAYAESVRTPVPPSTRRVTRKQNAVTFTSGTQTTSDSKHGNGECLSIELEDMERGGEAENLATSRELSAHDRIFKDKDRAIDVPIGHREEHSKTQPPIPKKRTLRNKHDSARTSTENSGLEVLTEKKEEVKEQRQTTPEQLESTQRSTTESQTMVACDNPNYRMDDKDPRNKSNPTYSLEEPPVSSKPRPGIIQTIVDEDDSLEVVRSSVQTLKLGNFVPNSHVRPQFSIDVFDEKEHHSTGVSEDSAPQSKKDNPKQQKKINKMLKDIMGPGLNTGKKKSPRKSQNGAAGTGGLLNFAFDDAENKQGNLSSKKRPKTTEVIPFGRKDLYASLPMGKSNTKARPISKSAVFDEAIEHACHHLDTPISLQKVNKLKKKFLEKEDEKLFTPRYLLEKDRNCFSDIDPVEDFTDVDANAPASDTEGVMAPRVISVRNTDKTVSMDSVRTCTDTELEITDYEDLSVTEGNNTHARKAPMRLNIRPERGQRGYDSRRKYLALNSLRRKTKVRVLNAEMRKRIRSSKT